MARPAPGRPRHRSRAGNPPLGRILAGAGGGGGGDPRPERPRGRGRRGSGGEGERRLRPLPAPPRRRGPRVDPYRPLASQSLGPQEGPFLAGPDQRPPGDRAVRGAAQQALIPAARDPRSDVSGSEFIIPGEPCLMERRAFFSPSSPCRSCLPPPRTLPRCDTLTAAFLRG